jgi:uncharacterized protein YbbK (DUF523 family)
VRPFSRPARATENFHTARKNVKYDLYSISVSMLKSKSPSCGLPRTFRVAAGSRSVLAAQPFLCEHVQAENA